MPSLRVATRVDGLRLVVRSCALAPLDEALEVTGDVLQALDVPTAIWHVSQGRWVHRGGLDDVPDPWDEHDWTFVPAVSPDQQVVAALLTPRTNPDDRGLLEVVGELVSAATLHDARRRRAHEDAQRFGVMQELAGAGVFDWNLQTDELVWSDQMYALHGRTVGRWKPTYAGWLRHVHHTDRNHVADAHLASLGTGEDWSVEARIVTADTGEDRWLRTRARVIKDERGQPARVIGVCVDVTSDVHAVGAVTRALEEAARLRAGQAVAMELNDNIVQGLALAGWSLDAGEYEHATQAIHQTLHDARKLTDRMLGGAADPVRPGDLVRREPPPPLQATDWNDTGVSR